MSRATGVGGQQGQWGSCEAGVHGPRPSRPMAPAPGSQSNFLGTVSISGKANGTVTSCDDNGPQNWQCWRGAVPRSPGMNTHNARGLVRIAMFFTCLQTFIFPLQSPSFSSPIAD